MIRSRRLALVAVVFAFGIASCGDPNATSTTTPVAAQPKVIQLASGARDSAEMAPAAVSTGAADSKIAYMGATEFVYDGDMPALDGPAASWYFAPGQQPDLDRVAKLAAAFGIKGDVRQLPQDQGGGWAVGPEDYSGPVLSVGSDGMLSWWLSSAPTAVSSGCAYAEGTAPAVGSGVAGSSGTAVDAVAPAETLPAETPTTAVMVPFPDCPVPQPPAGVPTKDEALAKAKELFASWGYDLNSYQFDEPYADEWNANVNASLVLDGMKAPITLSVGFGENGTVTWASGSLAEVQRGADYPTVGTAKGLERLKDQQNLYMGLNDTGVMKASTDEAAAGTVDASTGVAAPGVAIGAPDVAPVCEAGAAVDCGPISTDPVIVTLNSVKNDLTMVWATDETIWLLPAYTFGSADGGLYTVIAVADSFIQQPDPVTIEPATDPKEVPVPETALAPLPAECRSLTDVTVPSAPIDQIADAVIGYCLADAQDLAKTFGFTVRVVRQDGVDLAVTADYSESRINVAVENGTVTEFLSIG